MGAYTTATAFHTPAAITATTEDASWPASNVAQLTYPHRVFRTTSAAGTAQRLIIDFGQTRTLQAWGIDRTNAGSVIVEGNATNTWGTPSYGATVAISQDTLDGRYKLYNPLTGTSFENTGYRYASIRPAGTATTYGGTVWEVGSVWFAGTVSAWSENMGFPYRRTFLQATDEGVRLGGGASPTAIGNPYCRITLATQAMTESTMRPVLDGLMRAGRHVPLMFYVNDASTAEVYICRRVGEVGVDRAGAGHIEVAAIALEEFV